MALAVPGAASAAPRVGCVGQVGNPATPGSHHVFLLLQFLDGAMPADGYAVYRKDGMPASPATFTRMGVALPTSNADTIAALLARAADAGFDNAALETALDEIVPGVAGTLADKAAAFLLGGAPGGFDDLRRQTIVRTHPQMALLLGQAFLARAPDSGPSTFEVRVFHPATQAEGGVVGRVTTGTEPAILPAPDGLGERVVTSPQGHLRVLLRWCFPENLRRRALHWNGFTLFRVRHDDWNAAFGADPPPALDRALLLAAVDEGLAVPVNRLPVTPSEELPCPPPPNSEAYFLADDNDSADDGLPPDVGGTPFEDCDEVTYFVAARDHLGRIGHPSPGLPVIVCDRLPPLAPGDVRVENRYLYDEASETGTTFLEVSWDRDPADEVARYRVFRYRQHDEALHQRAHDPAWPATGNLVAILDNTGSSERITFLDDGNPNLAADPHPQIPGRTWWYVLVSEDATCCLDAAGLGNLSAPSGPVPGAIYEFEGPTRPEGRLLVPCCHLEGTGPDLGPVPPRGTPLALVADRNSRRVAWVEFREALTDTRFGRFEFGSDDLVRVTPDLPDSPPLPIEGLFEARFGSAFGQVTDWLGTPTISVAPFPTHTWHGRWTCHRAAAACPGGVVDPVDPETGELSPVCLDIVNPPADAVEFAFYRRLDDSGAMVRLQRGRFPDDDGDGFPDGVLVCEPAPPANPGTACYFLQYFDKNGNPSVVAPVGCIETVGTEGFPTPRITRFEPLNFFLPDGPVADVVLEWFCPVVGPESVERFEIRATPAMEGAARTEEIQLGAEAGVGETVTLGFLDSGRVAAAFGANSPAFTLVLGLQRGEATEIEVRAVGRGPADERLVGPWSDPARIAWVYDPSLSPGLCPVPWPARDPAPLRTDAATELHAELVAWEDLIDLQLDPVTEIWVEVGTFEAGSVLTPSSSGTAGIVPPRVEQRRFAAVLERTPFTVYLHQTREGSRGTMLQASHYVDEVLTREPEPGVLEIIDRSFAVKRRRNDDTGPYRLFFRVRQPLFQGRHYRCALVLHGEDREPIETLRTIEVATPISISVGP